MKSRIGYSMVLGFVLVAMPGCGDSGSRTGEDSITGSVGFDIQIGIGSGLTLTKITYDIAGSVHYTGTITAPAKSTTISSRIGNIAPGTYSVTLTGQANEDSSITCTGTSANLSVEAGKAAHASLSLVCSTGSPVADTGMVDISATASLTSCPTFLNDAASALEIPADGMTSVIFTARASSTVPAATLSWAAPSGWFYTATGSPVTYVCAPSTVTTVVPVTLTISNGASGCSPVGDVITITCTGVFNGSGGCGCSTGGHPPTGGTPPTGGHPPTGGTTNTGGVPPTGGTTNTGGVPPMGGTSSGGMCAGAAASCGFGDLAILNAHSSACGTCAQQNCGNYLSSSFGTAIDTANGFGSCYNTTVAALNQVQKVGTYQPTSITPTPLVAGVATNGTAVCLDVLSCVIKTGCASSGVASKCFCGDAVGADCVDSGNFPDGATYFASIGATTPVGYALDSSDSLIAGGASTTGYIDGACFLEEIDGRNSTSPTAVAGGFGAPNFPLGPANQLVTCLLNMGCTSCF